MKRLVVLVASLLMVVACSGANSGGDLFGPTDAGYREDVEQYSGSVEAGADVAADVAADVGKPDAYVPPAPGCVPESDKDFCTNKDCGVRIGFDNCGGSREVKCGPPTCGKSYGCQDNKCTCIPKSCNDLGFTCGPATDGCGVALECGAACPDGKACVANRCECVAPKHMCGIVPACVPNDDKACGPECINCKPDVPGVTPACVADTCNYDTCTVGYTRCPPAVPPMGPAGCSNLQNDMNNCGVCGIKCAVGKACVAGICSL